MAQRKIAKRRTLLHLRVACASKMQEQEKASTPGNASDMRVQVLPPNEAARTRVEANAPEAGVP
eukprot:7225049-Prorocentrum_lima.AAC.1